MISVVYPGTCRSDVALPKTARIGSGLLLGYSLANGYISIFSWRSSEEKGTPESPEDLLGQELSPHPLTTESDMDKPNITGKMPLGRRLQPLSTSWEHIMRIALPGEAYEGGKGTSTPVCHIPWTGSKL